MRDVNVKRRMGPTETKYNIRAHYILDKLFENLEYALTYWED